MPSTSLVVPGRFCGPATSANGGYASGLAAQALGRPAEVELRQPPPLDTPMRVVQSETGVEVLDDDGAAVLRARPLGEDEPAVAAPPPVTVAEAAAASKAYVGFERHPFPRCVTCGPERDEGDGLRIFPGQVEGRPPGTVAAAWRPDPALAAADGVVEEPIVWAALDCPTGFTAINADEDRAPYVLARFAVRLRRPVHAGQDHVVVAWPRGDEGRKHLAAAALLDAQGGVLAVANALWIQLRG
jgi:hypothetical protein